MAPGFQVPTHWYIYYKRIWRTVVSFGKKLRLWSGKSISIISFRRLIALLPDWRLYATWYSLSVKEAYPAPNFRTTRCTIGISLPLTLYTTISPTFVSSTQLRFHCSLISIVVADYVMKSWDVPGTTNLHVGKQAPYYQTTQLQLGMASRKPHWDPSTSWTP